MTDLARRWSSSYRARLAVGYLLIVALFAGAWGWSLFGPLTATIVEQQQTTLRAVAQAAVLVLAETDADAQETVDRLVARTDLRMTIVRADGTVLADSEEVPSRMENHAGRPEIAEALNGRIGTARRISVTQGTEQLYVAVPATFDGERVALRVSESLERINDVAAMSRRFGLALLAAALGLAAILVTRLTAAATGPIQRLTASARAMASGNLTTAITSESGDLAVLSGALLDLREQMRRRLDDLTAEQHNLRSVLDGLADAVFLFHDTSVGFANRTARELFRTPAAGFEGSELDSLALPAPVSAAIRDGLADGSPVAVESGPDAHGRYLRISVLPLSSSEAHARTLVVVADITERVNVDRIRREFVANASHELKTPTSAIHLLAESASTAASDGDIEQAVAFARQIAAESARLSRLVADLLDLSRIESLPPDAGRADVRAAIGNALLGHRVSATQRGLSLIVEDDVPDEDVFAGVDATDLAVALDNLLDNAVKYTESGGVTIGLDATDAGVAVTVRDTGIGIPAEDLTRIFERFYRVDRARSRDSGGTGLGLALVRHVAERANGTVEVRSEPGAGSTFTLTLPRVR